MSWEDMDQLKVELEEAKTQLMRQKEYIEKDELLEELQETRRQINNNERLNMLRDDNPLCKQWVNTLERNYEDKIITKEINSDMCEISRLFVSLKEYKDNKTEISKVLKELNNLEKIEEIKVKAIDDLIRENLLLNEELWPEVFEILQKIGRLKTIKGNDTLYFNIRWIDGTETLEEIMEKGNILTIKQLKELLMKENASYVNIEFLGQNLDDKYTWAEAGLGTKELNKIILKKKKGFINMIDKDGYAIGVLMDLSKSMEMENILADLIKEWQNTVQNNKQITEFLNYFINSEIPERLLKIIIKQIKVQLKKSGDFINEYRILLSRFGRYMRNTGIDQRPIKVDLMMGIMTDKITVHYCTKVKKIRKKVSGWLGTNEMVMLSYDNQMLDDEDYLLDYGCYADEDNEIIAWSVKNLRASNGMHDKKDQMGSDEMLKYQDQETESMRLCKEPEVIESDSQNSEVNKELQNSHDIGNMGVKKQNGIFESQRINSICNKSPWITMMMNHDDDAGNSLKG